MRKVISSTRTLLPFNEVLLFPSLCRHFPFTIYNSTSSVVISSFLSTVWGVNLPKPMMHIEYSPNFHKAHKFSSISAKFKNSLLFALNVLA